MYSHWLPLLRRAPANSKVKHTGLAIPFVDEHLLEAHHSKTVLVKLLECNIQLATYAEHQHFTVPSDAPEEKRSLATLAIGNISQEKQFFMDLVEKISGIASVPMAPLAIADAPKRRRRGAVPETPAPGATLAGVPAAAPDVSDPADAATTDAVPADSDPAPSVPDVSVPTQSVPDISVPAALVPGTTVPAASVPKASVPARSDPVADPTDATGDEEADLVNTSDTDPAAHHPEVLEEEGS